jgi:NAD(P)H-dependent FMN reductase
MAREYIAPREIDFLWADALVIGMPARNGTSTPEWKTYLDALTALHPTGKLKGKVATAFDSTLASLCSALAGLDLVLVPPGQAETALLHGRRVTEAARDLKRASSLPQPL